MILKTHEDDINILKLENKSTKFSLIKKSYL